MVTGDLLDRFLASARAQALREGTRYARQARVTAFAGTPESVSTMVRGQGDDYEVALWTERGALHHRCECRSWRDPCKHEVAAAIALRGALARGEVHARSAAGVDGRSRTSARPDSAAKRGAGRDGRAARNSATAPVRGKKVRATDSPVLLARDTPAADPAQARTEALAERARAARAEKLVVQPDDPPFVRVASASGFSYRVQLRGDARGPHGCECPDFEANRLHTCKHVERVRVWLDRSAPAWLRGHRDAAERPRVYLYFGEIVEPRLFGRPRGPGADIPRAAFDGDGVALQPMATDPAALRRSLDTFLYFVEPEAIAWLDARIAHRPVLPEVPFARLLPKTSLRPYPYQRAGAEFLARRGRALLADEMGLGKTVQAILAASALGHAREPVRRVTVVCPASLRGNWQDEIRRWVGDEAVLVEGSAAKRAHTIGARPAWLVTHYEQLWRDYPHHAAHAPDLLIIDEAQRAKGLATRTARVLKAIPARHVFALTGTPLENRLEEAYAIAQLVDQRLLPPLWQLDRDHFVRDEAGRRVLMYRGLGELRSRLAPAFLRRRKEDVALELPERVRSVSLLPMHPAAHDTHEDIMWKVGLIAKKKVILPADMERMQKLLVIARRACDGPHMLRMKIDDHKVPKLAELSQLLEELCLGEGRKAVVFSEWTDMTERVESVCRRLGLFAVHLHGGVPVKRRPALIRAFTEYAGPAVFVSTEAGGVGLNLQAADVVVNLDLPWNPARLEQRIARAHRIGSKGTVRVVLLVTEHSVEQRILGLHDLKRNILDNVWAKDGDDQIQAPGGSGAFRDMVRELLKAEPPGKPPARADATRAGENARPRATGRGDGGIATAAHSDGSEAASREKRLRSAAPSRAAAPTPPGRTRTGTPSTVPLDPTALAAAVSGIAAVVPIEQRASLAAIFRTVAEALATASPA
jgi:superfamily II DNA or RNA helicase